MEEDHEGYGLSELMAMALPKKEEADPVICAECGKEILPSTVRYNNSKGRVHSECFKSNFSNVVPLIPVGCENIQVWRNPPSF